jgi:hypothetical protein
MADWPRLPSPPKLKRHLRAAYDNVTAGAVGASL